MAGSDDYVEKCAGITNKLEEVITDVQDTQLVAYLLGSSAESTRFLQSLDKDVSLLKVMIFTVLPVISVLFQKSKRHYNFKHQLVIFFIYF